MKKRGTLIKLTLSAMFLALGLTLPFLTGQIKEIGSMLLPMHLPVFLCALICGWPYGLAVGLILPVMRSLLFGMPPLYPIAISMTFELATYAFVSGFLYEKINKNRIWEVYVSLISAMLAGRAVWGIVQAILLGISGNAFTLKAFMAGAFLNAIPGIILQLILIPVIMLALTKAKLVPIGKKN